MSDGAISLGICVVGVATADGAGIAVPDKPDKTGSESADEEFSDAHPPMGITLAGSYCAVGLRV